VTAGRVLAIAGAICAGVGLSQAGAPIGAAAWLVAWIVAANGYGDAVARIAEPAADRPGFALATVTGLAIVIAGSTVLAQVGVLAREVQIGGVIIGLALRAATPARGPGRPPAVAMARRGWWWTLAMIAATLLVAVELTDLVPLIDDDINHAGAIKRLWDTGALASLPHQLGGQVVGEAYAALGGGAELARVFDAGACAALLVLVLAEALGRSADRIAPGLLVVVVLAIMMMPEPQAVVGARWSGALLHVAAIVAVHRVFVGTGGHWRVAVLVGALATLRHEYAVLAATYGVAVCAFDGAAGGRRRVIAVVGWAAALVAVQLALGTPVALAGVKAAITTAAIPLVWCLLPALAVAPAASALVVALVAATAATLAGAIRLVPDAHAAASLGFVTWFGAVVGILAIDAVATGPIARTPRLRVGAAAVITVAIAVQVVLTPPLVDHRLAALRDRFAGAVARWSFVETHGYGGRDHARAGALQGRVPRGARLGFWGRSPGALDYARNPVRDVSRSGTRFLQSLTQRDLAAVDYLIVEDHAPMEVRRPDVWGSKRTAPTAAIEPWIEMVATVGSTRLVRVRR
jgi:hypothetical protein